MARINQILDACIDSGLRTMDERQRREDVRTGRTDGARAQEDLGAVHPFANGRIAQARAAIATFDKSRREHLHDLRSREHELVGELERVTGPDLDDAREKMREDLDGLRRASGDLSIGWKTAEQAQHDAKTDRDRLKASLGRPIRIPPVAMRWLYYPALAFLAVAETPLNARAFDVVLGEAQGYAYILALVTGIVLIGLAHAVGKAWRQIGHASRAGKIKTVITSILSMIFVGGLLYMLALARGAMTAFDQAMSQGPLGGGIFDGAGQGMPVMEIVRTVMANGLQQDGAVLLMVNLGLILLGLLLSYFRYDPHPDYERLETLARKTAKVFDKMVKAYERKRVEIEKRHKAIIDGLQRRAEQLAEQIDRLNADITAAEQILVNVLNTMTQTLSARLHAYNEGWAAAATTARITQAALALADLETIRSNLMEALGHDDALRAAGRGTTRLHTVAG